MLGIQSVWGATMVTGAVHPNAHAPPPLHHSLLFANVTDAHRVTLAELHSIEEAQGRLNAETALPFMYVAHEFYSHRTVAVDTTKPLIVQAETFGRQCEGFDRDYYCVRFELWSLAR